MTQSAPSTLAGEQPSPPPPPGKRDPEGRRRAILEAAAEIVVTRGATALTHRSVAQLAGVSLGSTTQYFASIDELRDLALEHLAHEIEASLRAFEPELLSTDDLPGALARESYEFMQNPRAVRADVALMSGGIADPELRPLALLWTNHTVEVLSRRVGVARATAIALYLDGALMRAGLTAQPVDIDEMRAAIHALLGMH